MFALKKRAKNVSGHSFTEEELSALPRHVGVIMDGNGRWAKKHKLNVSQGHRAGTEALREIIRHADAVGIQCLSLYAFSTENKKRSREEVDALMQLILEFRGVTFMDSSGIGLIMGRSTMMKVLGGKLYIRNPPPQVVRVLHLAQINTSDTANEVYAR